MNQMSWIKCQGVVFHFCVCEDCSSCFSFISRKGLHSRGLHSLCSSQFEDISIKWSLDVKFCNCFFVCFFHLFNLFCFHSCANMSVLEWLDGRCQLSFLWFWHSANLNSIYSWGPLFRWFISFQACVLLAFGARKTGKSFQNPKTPLLPNLL